LLRLAGLLRYGSGYRLGDLLSRRRRRAAGGLEELHRRGCLRLAVERGPCAVAEIDGEHLADVGFDVEVLDHLIGRRELLGSVLPQVGKVGLPFAARLAAGWKRRSSAAAASSPRRRALSRRAARFSANRRCSRWMRWNCRRSASLSSPPCRWRNASRP